MARPAFVAAHAFRPFPDSHHALMIENRHRCSADRHPGMTYNPLRDETWCRCGRVVRPGHHAQWPSEYERAEWDCGRFDEVGSAARETLDRLWGRRRPEIVTTATELS